MQKAFLRRDLLRVPVAVRPRDGTDLLIKNREFLGSTRLAKTSDVEYFMSAKAMGLSTVRGSQVQESWWVVSSGRWCPYYYYHHHYYYYYYY